MKINIFSSICRQKDEEAKRQKEMEMLFSEEAEKMWNKQETVWKREEDARKKLMDDVLAGLKEQIRAKLQGIFFLFWNHFKVYFCFIEFVKNQFITVIENARQNSKVLAHLYIFWPGFY